MVGTPIPGRKPARRAARRADAWLLAAILVVFLGFSGREALPSPGPGDPSPDPALLVHRVDLDRAGEAELRLLPGVGPRLAERILAERSAGGPFASPEDLARRVDGVGPDRVRRWKGRIAPPSRAPR